MGITIGDSLSVVATLLGLGVTTWALVMVVSLLFEGKARQAKSVLADSPWKCFAIGLMLILTVGLISVALASAAEPVLKLVGTIGYLWLLAQGALGVAGLAHLVADRISEQDPQATPYRAFLRATGLIVVAGYLPILGWFAFAPLVLAASIGSGVLAVFRRGYGEALESRR